MRLFNVLMVEDNPGDVRLAEEVLRDSPFLRQLYVASDGEAALAFLNSPARETPRPDLIILDLNLPRKDGRSVLKEVKNDERLRTIPIIVFTTSRAEQDIVRSYDLFAACYITKPFDLDSAEYLLQAIANFWFTIVTLPQPMEGE